MKQAALTRSTSGSLSTSRNGEWPEQTSAELVVATNAGTFLHQRPLSCISRAIQCTSCIQCIKPMEIAIGNPHNPNWITLFDILEEGTN
jgi:hypothetical protein